MSSTATPRTTTPGTRGARLAARILATAAAGGLSIGALAGCSLLQHDAWAVSYEAVVVSGAAADASTTVEYTDRAKRGEAQTKITQEAAVGGGAVVYESIAELDENVSVTVAAVPGAVVSCAIKLDGERILAEAQSEVGEAVECTATTPASLDD
ncbi:hypothetical protein [Pseudoclavibacter helvolus]|uniref:hypothetical protein n=1 Tax=Pseudoclavibacter helvolus TaxID=255205 RepID=UPI003C78B847